MKQMYKIKPVLQTMLCYGMKGGWGFQVICIQKQTWGKVKHKNEYINRNQNEYISTPNRAKFLNNM